MSIPPTSHMAAHKNIEAYLENNPPPLPNENSGSSKIAKLCHQWYIKDVVQYIENKLKKRYILNFPKESVCVYFNNHLSPPFSLEEIKKIANQFLHSIFHQEKAVLIATRRVLNGSYIRKSLLKNSSDLNKTLDSLCESVFSKIYENEFIDLNVPLSREAFNFVGRECGIAVLKDYISMQLQSEHLQFKQVIPQIKQVAINSLPAQFVVEKLLSYLRKILSPHILFEKDKKTLRNEDDLQTLLKSWIEEDLHRAGLSKEIREKVQKILNSPEHTILKDFLEEIKKHSNTVLYAPTGNYQWYPLANV